MLKLINNRKATEQAAKLFIDNLDSGVYIIGCNKYGEAVLNWLKNSDKNVVGFIDDFTQAEFFLSIPVVKSKSDFSGAAIINCSVEGQSVNVKKLIAKTNAKSSTDYFTLEALLGKVLLPIDYLDETNHIIKDWEQYSAVYERMEDSQSKQEFESLLNFRINRDTNYLNEFKFRINEQYFENFFSLNDNGNFVDAGGFDGFTSLTFAKKYPNYGKIFYFEPTSISNEKSKATLVNTRDVVYFQNGLWDKNETLRFNNNLGNSSRISEVGIDKIAAVALDDVVFDRVDFIKMDIEGAEQKALVGAHNIIKKWKPIIAVCVYHKQSDMLDIPRYLLDINPNYKLYFRHYTQGTCESVMYFV